MHDEDLTGLFGSVPSPPTQRKARRPRGPGSIYVRHTDPGTSQAAAVDAELSADQGRERAHLVITQDAIRGGLTYEQIADAWTRRWGKVAESTPRKRAGDLKKVEYGALVVESTVLRPLESGRMGMVLCLRCDGQHPPRTPSESELAPSCLDPACWLNPRP